MKKFAVFFATLLLATASTFAAATIQVNGKEVKSSVMPIEKNGTTLVPIRLISEEMGAIVKWFPEEKGILILKGDTSLYMKVGSTKLEVGYNSTKASEILSMSMAPVQVNGTTMVPLRAISEGLGCEINYSNGVISIVSSVESTYLSTDNELYIEEELNTQFGTCTTDIGNIDMFFWVYENVNKEADEVYDYQVYGKFEDAEFAKIYGAELQDEALGKAVKAQLRNHMEKIAKMLIANHGNVKFEGGYDMSFYEDVTDEESWIYYGTCNWSNIEEDAKGTYAGSKKVDFMWQKDWDVEEW